MPRWIPVKWWEGQDAFIIGGGDSLKSFDWNLLRSENTIGCNDAFLHGIDICKICIFGDPDWFKAFKCQLEQYKGTVFTNVQKLNKSRIDWLWTMDRAASGLHGQDGKALGWNYNTGALAINLALLLGVKRIFLLGFDMQLSEDGKGNWHSNKLNKPDAKIYAKFLRGFKALTKELNKFPGVEIINVTDDSKLEVFPKVSVEDFWKERKAS